MGTRSTITARLRDGTYRCVYCHWDGYPEGPNGVGWKLQKHYNTQELAEVVTSLGSLSSLDTTIDNSTVHHRDRGDSWVDCKPGVGATHEEALDAIGSQEYDYLWDGTVWHITSGGSPKDIISFIANRSAPA